MGLKESEKVSLIEEIRNNVKIAEKMPISKLVSVLTYLSDVYYNSDTSLLPDEVYDKLRDILEKRDPTHKYLKQIGAPGTKEQVELPYPMASLDKIKLEKGGIDKWTKKYKGPYVISDKLDGGSAQLYKDSKGKLFLFSRGEEVKGQNISHLIPNIIPKSVKLDDIPNNTSIRGELIISKKNFTKIAGEMKNARNAVAGIINAKHPNKNVVKVTDFIAYNILHPRMFHKEQFIQLKKWGFDVAYYKSLPKISESILEKVLTERKKDSNYEIDGIVCFDDSTIHDLKLGNPDYGFAFKMIVEDQTVITTVNEVLWDISMDKLLKPRVKFDPVELLGTTVKYATAHNAKFIVDNKIGKGAKIKIIKSGDVIPYILEVVKPAKEIGLPENMTYKWNETKVNFVATDVKGDAKERVNVKLLMHFFKYMNIKHLSEGILTKFVENGYDTVPKILKAKQDKLAKIEGLGEKSIVKIFEQISNSFKTVKLHTFMASSHKFGAGLGERKIEEITNKYPNILTVKWSKEKMIEKILEIDGFGEKLAKLFTDKFDDFVKFYKEINKIIDISRFETKIQEKDIKQTKGKTFEGKSFVFTGFRDKELEQFIKDNGGKVSTSISSKTYMLIHSDSETDKPSQKILSAQELNIKTMSKSAFEKKYK